MMTSPPGQLSRDIAHAAEASGGQVSQVEYELWAPAALGEPPSDTPAWYWCTLKQGGREFLSAIEATVGSDSTVTRVADQGGSRVFSLAGAGNTALLLEDEWVDATGTWHYQFRLRRGGSAAVVATPAA
jgi:hypothetical protein